MPASTLPAVGLQSERGKAPPRMLPARKVVLLAALVFLICLGLGYPVLNRYDPRAVTGLADVGVYTRIVSGTERPLDLHMRFRVLVPYLARPVYRLAMGRIGTWDPALFSLLVVNSLFTTATVVLLLAIGLRVADYGAAMFGAFLFLLNFAVPNLRLAGLIDAGEGFFLLAVVWALLSRRYALLPLWGILGAWTKETFVPFYIVFTGVWWWQSRGTADRKRLAAWIGGSWIVMLAAFAALHWALRDAASSPLQYVASFHHNSAYLRHFVISLADRNLWYVFIWLLPLSLFKLKELPRPWLVATAAAGAVAFLLDAYYGGAPGTVGRALFSIAGPMLSLSAGMWLAGWSDFHSPPA